MARAASPDRDPAPPAPRPLWVLVPLGLLAALLFAGLVALGIWQVQRLGWKLDLIERVEARLAADPVPAPGPPDWAAVSAASDEYRRVEVSGVFRHDLETQVQALTEEGGGFWVLTPAETAQGWSVLVNRGFVPSERRDPAGRGEAPAGEGPVTVSGLLRMTEPGGGFLRDNDPAQERWFSRDVAAIAAARGLDDAAPYFIDAGAGPDPAALPRGGLTVVSFRNNHLGYALTWFALAAGVLAAAVWVGHYEWRLRHARDNLAAPGPGRDPGRSPR